MKKNIKIYLYGIIALTVVAFFAFVFPYITEYFFYSWAHYLNKKYLFINNIYSSITAIGFALVSLGIISYVISKDIKNDMLKIFSLTVLLLGVFIIFLFIISKPVNDRIGFLRENNGDIYMYTGFHVKEKVIFVKKEKIFHKDINNKKSN